MGDESAVANSSNICKDPKQPAKTTRRMAQANKRLHYCKVHTVCNLSSIKENRDL